MNKPIFIKKEKQSFPIIAVTAVAILTGIVLIVSGVWWQVLIGVILLLTCPFVIFTRSVFFYDPTDNIIIIKRKMLIFENEKKETLPKIQYIAVVTVKTSQNLNVLSITTQINDISCQVNFIHQNSKKRFTKLISMKKEKALKLALDISERINKPVFDNTTGEKIWINK